MNLVKRHPLIVYFALAYGFSLAPFPFLIPGVAAASVLMTALTGGRSGLGELWSRMRRCDVRPVLYMVQLIPPAGVLATLLLMRLALGPAFMPGLQLFGLPIGVVAGFFEEIGWTGFAYPRMRARLGSVRAALLLGLLWGLWHLAVIDSLGAATPHGAMLPEFFAAFAALVAGIRCLICWLYDRTGSVLLAQMLHASFTGTLILFSAPHVSAGQEALWYAVYAAIVWLGLTIAFQTHVWGTAPGSRRSSRARAAE